MKQKTLTYRHRLVCAIPYSLLHFLIEYECLRKYLDNCCKDPSIGFITSLEKEGFLAYNDLGVLFTWAFTWNETPEGYDYWYRKRQWYLEYLKTNKL